MSITPTWQRGDVQLFLGDCRDILGQFAPGTIDAVVTDPPYGVDFSGKATKHSDSNGVGYIGGDDAAIGPATISTLVEMGLRAIVFSGNANAFSYPRPRDIGGVFCSNGVGLGRWGFTCFHIILFYGTPPHGCTLPTGFSYSHHRPDATASGHPCPKPIYWMEWATKLGSSKGQTILDPFMGSGTTGVAAVKLGRKFIGIEIEPKYFDIAVRRISEAQDQFALFDPVPPPVKQAELFGGGE